MSELNLYQKIVEVRKIAEGFSKDKSSFNYSYVSGNQVLSKIKDKMNELNLLLFPSTKMGEHHTHAYKTSKGKDVLDFVVKGEMSYTWINGDVPAERETVSWAYYGQQDDISKAYGSALTYSERYYLLKSLGLPTDEDDPDAKQEKPAYKAPQQQQSTTPQQTTATTTGSTNGSTPKLISESQIKYSQTLKTKKNISEEDFKAMISELGNGKESIKEMTAQEASKFINLLTNYAA